MPLLAIRAFYGVFGGATPPFSSPPDHQGRVISGDYWWVDHQEPVSGGRIFFYSGTRGPGQVFFKKKISGSRFFKKKAGSRIFLLQLKAARLDRLFLQPGVSHG
jgi:hypothetical protein